MTDTTIDPNRTPLRWSVIIAGSLASWAVSFIFISLGTGVGLAVTSPYAGATATTMTIGGAIWLIIAQSFSYATGGYLAGRLRIRDHIPGPETTFRDAAHGFMVWVLGVGSMAVVVAITTALTTKAGATPEQALSDAARTAAAYLSFWSFMALLFGAVAATLAGMLGGEIRDEEPEVNRSGRRKTA